jgi:predicted nuclease with TOPRIM domain
LTNSSSPDRDASDSEILELEEMLPSPNQSRDIPSDFSRRVIQDATVTSSGNGKYQPKIPTVVRSIEIGSRGEVLNVSAEIDALIDTIELANPHPPQLVREASALPNRSPEIADRQRRQQESYSISETIAEIAASETDTDSQLHRELTNIHQQIATARHELQTLHQRNQSQVETIDAHADRIDRLKVRTQQLAYYAKNRVGKVQELITAVDAIRAEIVTGLEKFGGYHEMRSLLAELETSRHALVLAHDRLCTGQETFYESLQAIEQRVTSHSNDSVARLRQYQELIETRSQTLSTDRQQIAEMSVDVSLKYAQIQELSTQIRDMHAQITEKSQLIHRRVTDTERGFSELAASVQLEKDQFYELTAETIDRTAAIQDRFSKIDREFSLDREAIAALKSELVTVREGVERASEKQIDYFDSQFYELLADWSELSEERQERGGDSRKILTWLWILSFAVGLALAFSLYILMHLK